MYSGMCTAVAAATAAAASKQREARYRILPQFRTQSYCCCCSAVSGIRHQVPVLVLSNARLYNPPKGDMSGEGILSRELGTIDWIMDDSACGRRD